MEFFGITMHTKKTLGWSHQNLWRPEKIWKKIKNALSSTVVVEACTKERANKIWKKCKFTKVTVFVALLKENSMGCIEAELPEPLTKNHTANTLC